MTACIGVYGGPSYWVTHTYVWWAVICPRRKSSTKNGNNVCKATIFHHRNKMRPEHIFKKVSPGDFHWLNSFSSASNSDSKAETFIFLTYCFVKPWDMIFPYSTGFISLQHGNNWLPKLSIPLNLNKNQINKFYFAGYVLILHSLYMQYACDHLAKCLPLIFDLALSACPYPCINWYTCMQQTAFYDQKLHYCVVVIKAELTFLTTVVLLWLW